MKRGLWQAWAAALLMSVGAASGLAAKHSHAENFLHGHVVAVSDGDTVVVKTRSETIRVRIAAIDCPELHQAYGYDARALTAALALDHDVTLRVVDHDRYDRTVADVSVDGGADVGQELLRAGLAWWYRAHSRRKELQVLESAARSARRGLWADPQPMAPWRYRHLHPRVE